MGIFPAADAEDVAGIAAGSDVIVANADWQQPNNDFAAVFAGKSCSAVISHVLTFVVHAAK